jgi:hypothetical protein
MSREKELTAVEWLLEQLDVETVLTRRQLSDVINKAKEMEKESHKKTWDVAHQAGRFEGKGIAEENWQTFETYWEENL